MKILLTGSNGGIGSAIEQKLRGAGHEIISVTRADADLSNERDVAALAEKISKEEGSIDWLVCAHGFIDTETELEKTTAENIEATFRINILSIIYLAQHFLPHIAQGGGIISLSSSAGVQANGRLAPYSASKAAVNSFMQALARNRPEKKFFAVAPGPTNTGMRQRLAGDASTQQSPEVVAQVIEEVIAQDSSYKSGDIILVKSGETSVVSRI